MVCKREHYECYKEHLEGWHSLFWIVGIVSLTMAGALVLIYAVNTGQNWSNAYYDHLNRPTLIVNQS